MLELKSKLQEEIVSHCKQWTGESSARTPNQCHSQGQCDQVNGALNKGKAN